MHRDPTWRARLALGAAALAALSAPAVAVAAVGDLFVSNTSTGHVYVLRAATPTVPEVIVEGLLAPTAIAFHNSFGGRLYVADAAGAAGGSGFIYEFRNGGIYGAVLAEGFVNVTGMAFGPNGALWVADSERDGGGVFRIDPGEPPVHFSGPSVTSPAGVAVDPYDVFAGSASSVLAMDRDDGSSSASVFSDPNGEAEPRGMLSLPFLNDLRKLVVAASLSGGSAGGRLYEIPFRDPDGAGPQLPVAVAALQQQQDLGPSDRPSDVEVHPASGNYWLTTDTELIEVAPFEDGGGIQSRFAHASLDSPHSLAFASNFQSPVQRPYPGDEEDAFTPLGELVGVPVGDPSYARSLTPDGQIVIGSGLQGREGWRWSEAEGAEILDPPSRCPECWIFGLEVSSDGSVVVGSIDHFDIRAVRWVGTEFHPLPIPPDLGGEDKIFEAWDVSGDGQTVVGWYEIDPEFDYLTYRWTEAGGYERLPALPGTFEPFARGISLDGSVVYGNSSGFAVVWPASGGVIALPNLPGSNYNMATASSADGSRFFGSARIGSIWHAVLWRDGAVEDLGIIPSDYWSPRNATASGDRMIAGNYYWHESVGLVDFQTWLAGQGVTPTGWPNLSACCISDDGLTFAGTGTNPFGDSEAWIVRLPEPSTALGLGASLLLLLGLARRRELRQRMLR